MSPSVSSANLKDTLPMNSAVTPPKNPNKSPPSIDPTPTKGLSSTAIESATAPNGSTLIRAAAASAETRIWGAQTAAKAAFHAAAAQDEYRTP
jgi:hypothetical protein